MVAARPLRGLERCLLVSIAVVGLAWVARRVDIPGRESEAPRGLTPEERAHLERELDEGEKMLDETQKLLDEGERILEQNRLMLQQGGWERLLDLPVGSTFALKESTEEDAEQVSYDTTRSRPERGESVEAGVVSAQELLRQQELLEQSGARPHTAELIAQVKALEAEVAEQIRNTDIEVLQELVLDLCEADDNAKLKQIMNAVNETLRRRLANSVRNDTETGARKTALFLATTNRSPSVVATLLRARANVTLGRLDEGTMPVHLAAGWLYDDKVLEYLVGDRDKQAVIASLKAKPWAGGLRDHTPPWWAAFYGQEVAHHWMLAWLQMNGWKYSGVEDDEFTWIPEEDTESRERYDIF